MKFVFGPIHRFSKWFYAIGLPVVFITVLDLAMSLGIFDDQFRMQLFFLGAILITIGGIINISVHVIGLIRNDQKP